MYCRVKGTDSRGEMVRWVVEVGLLQTTLLTGVLRQNANLI
jgi:hypothetical protein